MGDLAALRDTLRELDRVVVAFSGGADSSFLAWVANDTLGRDRVACVTAVSPSLASFEHDECARLAGDWNLDWIEVSTNEMHNAAYRRNDADRCFWCKDALMDALDPIAAQRDAIVVLGVNLDDLGDHRPGQRAAAQRGARFPLVDARFTKAELRDASRALGLRTWDKPAAACLASRLPYGTPVELGVLASVEAAEHGLHLLGFRDVRVRHYRDLARVEVPLADLDALLRLRDEVVAVVKAAGYRYVTVDLEGLRSGNLNAALHDPVPFDRRHR
jgi:uncharacterized protein